MSLVTTHDRQHFVTFDQAYSPVCGTQTLVVRLELFMEMVRSARSPEQLRVLLYEYCERDNPEFLRRRREKYAQKKQQQQQKQKAAAATA